MPLLTISNERIDMETIGIDWSKVNIVKIVDNGLDFYFHSLFFILFYFYFYFYFLFLEQLGLGSIGHTVTSDTDDGMVT